MRGKSMKILISQPKNEVGLTQLRKELALYDNFDALLYPEGYVKEEKDVETLCNLAKEYKKIIITGYLDLNKKDRALIVDRTGKIILERSKSPMNGSLYSPSIVKTEETNIGYLLCVEILQGLEGLEKGAMKMDFIAHPIGVGMFSDEQFTEWIDEAVKISSKYNTMIFGTSHSDGSFRNCGFSIPISYWIDENGEPIFISKNDTRSRIINLETKGFIILD